MSEFMRWDEADAKLYAWAARKLEVPRDQVAKVETDWWSNCETCEYSTGCVRVILADGRVFSSEEEFVQLLHEILYYVDEEGQPTDDFLGTLWERLSEQIVEAE